MEQARRYHMACAGCGKVLSSKAARRKHQMHCPKFARYYAKKRWREIDWRNIKVNGERSG